MTMGKKTLPINNEAEMSVIGGVLLDNDKFDLVSEHLQKHHFAKESHRLIWGAMSDLLNDSEPVDVVTVASKISETNLIDRIGGMSYLAELMEYVPSAANIMKYVKLVREAYYRRELLNISHEIEEGIDEGVSVPEISEFIEKRVFELGDDRSTGPVDIKKSLKKAFDRMEFAYNNRGTILGVPTGLSKLDVLLAGLLPSKLYILAARPSMGKTALALNVADNAAVNKGIPTAVFTLEMPSDELTERLICSRARVDSGRARSGNLRDSDWPKLTNAAGQIGTAEIFIDDTPALRLMEFKSRARKLKRQHNIGLIIIDYLQLMACPGEQSRQQEIGAISRGLKNTAKELGIPVLALSQLNRSLESRPNKRPIMSDLRESGDIEQDADVIMFLYREAVYCEDCKAINKKCEAGHERDAELNIAKQRGGPTGTLPLDWYGEHTLFLEPEARQMEAAY